MDPFYLMMGLFVLLVVVAVLSTTGSDGKPSCRKGRVV